MLAEIWNVTREQYFADTDHVSHTAIEVFRESPLLYYQTYIAKTVKYKPATRQQILGTHLHTRTLEPVRWRDTVAVMPTADKKSEISKLLLANIEIPSEFASLYVPAPADINRRTKIGREQWAEFIDANPGKEVIKAEHFEEVQRLLTRYEGKFLIDEEQYNLVERMAQAVYEHPEAAALLATPGPTEQAIRWECTTTGVLCKSLQDKITMPQLIIDLKSAVSAKPEPFARAINRFGYDRQAGHYVDGREHVIGEPCKFGFIAVQSSEPYTVAVYELDKAAASRNAKTRPLWIEKARAQNHFYLNQIKARREEFARTGSVEAWKQDFELQSSFLNEPAYAAYEGAYEADLADEEGDE